jgi:hypothetical protein
MSQPSTSRRCSRFRFDEGESYCVSSQRPSRYPFWSHTDDGNASEKSLAELGGDPLPPGRGLDQEKGFPGFVLPGLTIVQPQTTPRGGELTPPEQATHRRRAAISRRIAHAMGG